MGVVSPKNSFKDEEGTRSQLEKLKVAGVDGIMVDVWWGTIEAKGPKQYDWTAYRRLFKVVEEYDLKIQAISVLAECGIKNISILKMIHSHDVDKIFEMRHLLGEKIKFRHHLET